MIPNSVDRHHVIALATVALVVVAYVAGPSTNAPEASLDGPESVAQSERVTLTATVPTEGFSPDAFRTEALTIRNGSSRTVDVAFHDDGTVTSVTPGEAGEVGSTHLDRLREGTRVRVRVEGGAGPYGPNDGPVRLIVVVSFPADGLPPGEYVAEVRIAVEGGADIVVETRFRITPPNEGGRDTGETGENDVMGQAGRTTAVHGTPAVAAQPDWVPVTRRGVGDG